MSRTLPTGLAELLTAKVVPLAFLIEIDWPDGTVYLWNGYHSLTWDSKTFVGVGYLGEIGDIRESKDLGANGLMLTLSGIPSSLIAEALRRDIQGREVRVWLGVLGGDVLATDPLEIYRGQMDTASVNDNGSTSSISLQVESELIDNRSNFRRYNHQDQQIDHPGDMIFQYVAVLGSVKVTWGKKTLANYNPSAVLPGQLI